MAASLSASEAAAAPPTSNVLAGTADVSEEPSTFVAGDDDYAPKNVMPNTACPGFMREEGPVASTTPEKSNPVRRARCSVVRLLFIGILHVACERGSSYRGRLGSRRT